MYIHYIYYYSYFTSFFFKSQNVIFSQNYGLKLTMETCKISFLQNEFSCLSLILFCTNMCDYFNLVCLLVALTLLEDVGCETSVWALHVCQSYFICFRVIMPVMLRLPSGVQEHRVFKVWTGSELNSDVAERKVHHVKPFRTLIMFLLL